MITFLCLLAIFIFALDAQVFPSTLTALGGSSLQQGLLLSSLFFFFPLSSIVAGYLADRIGKRILIIIGLGLMALSFSLCAFFSSIWLRTISVLLFGLGSGSVESQVSAFLSDLHQGRERAVLNTSQTFFSLGAAGGPFLIALIYRLIPGLGLKTLLWGVAVVTALTAAAFLFDPNRRSVLVLNNPVDFKKLLKNKTLRWLSLSIFIYVAAESGISGWLVKYAELNIGLPRAVAPVYLTLFWGGLGISRALVGFLSGRLSDRTLLTVSLSCTLAAQILTFLSTHVTTVMIGIFLIGFCMGCVWPTLVALTGAMFRGSSGTAVGIVISAGGLAVPLIHPLIGFASGPGLLGLKASLLALGIFTVLNIMIVQFIAPKLIFSHSPGR